MEKSCDPHFYSSSLCCLNCNCSSLNARMVYFLELKTLKQSLELKAVVTFLFYIWGEELCINSRKCFSKELTAFRTWGLPQLRRLHFSGNLFSVALKALFTSSYQIVVFKLSTVSFVFSTILKILYLGRR